MLVNSKGTLAVDENFIYDRLKQKMIPKESREANKYMVSIMANFVSDGWHTEKVVEEKVEVWF